MYFNIKLLILHLLKSAVDLLRVHLSGILFL